METTKQAGNLKIGDVVLLFNKGDKKAENAGNSGFILADLSGSSPQQLLTIQPSHTTSQELSNFKFGTFQVLSANKYEAQTRYRALLEKLKEYKKKRVGKSAIQLLELKVTQAKRDGEVERSENAAKQKRLQGSKVCYGDSIQLLHTLTGKYVCVSTTDTSKTENTKLLVFLQRKDSIGCIFRLHPHIKVQTVGKDVDYNDQIKFESLATEGQYLHCSEKTFGEVNINSFRECYELNLAVKDSPLKIVRHYHSITKSDPPVTSTIRGSGIVRFLHQKHQCYIVGDGSFAGEYGQLPDISEDLDGHTQLDIADQLLLMSARRKGTSTSSSIPTSAKSYETSKNTKADFETLFGKSSESLQQSNSDLAGLIPSAVGGYDMSYDTEDNVVSEDVHFSKWCRSGTFSSQASSTSPKTFWQIEKFSNPYSGEPIEWSEQCRIKHLPTRRYLAVTPDHKVTLKSQQLPSSLTVFELFPVVQQVGGQIYNDSHVRIQHRDTGTWLHLNKDLRYFSDESESETTEEEETGTFNEFEETKELYKMIVTKDINPDDAFILERVDDKLAADFNYVAGVTAFLGNQLKQCNLFDGRPHSPEECRMGPALSSLHHLQSLIVKDKETVKNKQKFIRCMRTLVIVVRLLGLHRDEKSNDPEVCTACFGVITNFLEGNSKKNKMYVSSMMKHIFTTSVKDTEMTGSQTVEKALVGIAKDNMYVLYEEVLMRRIVDYVMQKLQVVSKESTKAVQLLEILNALCTCKGVSVKQNQLIIMEQLQCIATQENKLLYSLRVYKKDREQVAITMESPPTVKRNNQKSGYNCIQFQALESQRSSKSGHWYELSRGNKHLHQFLVAQLNLLVQMCRGDNTKVIETLQGGPDTEGIGVHIDFTLIMAALKDKSVRISYPKLRAVFMELLKVMYVEVGENRPYLEKFPSSFKIDEVGQVPFESSTKCSDPMKAAITSLTGVENEHFPTIRDWIRHFLQDESEYFFAAEENDRNEVVVKVLQLLTVLVKFGYYDDNNDLKQILPAIHKFLNGKEDFPTRKIKMTMDRGTTNTNFCDVQFTVSSAESVEVKLNTKPDQDSDEMDKVLAKFREEGKRYFYDEKYRNHFEIKHWAMELLSLLFNFLLFKSLHSFVYDFRWIFHKKCTGQDERESSPYLFDVLDEDFDELEQVEVKQPGHFSSGLMDLITTNPRDPEFSKQSPNVAEKIISTAKKRLKSIVQKADGLDLSHHPQLPHRLLDLANYKHDDLSQRSLLLLDRYYTSQSGIFEIALHTQLLKTPQSCALYNTLEGVFLELLVFLQSGSRDEVWSDPSPVKLLTSHCWLEEEVEGYEPNEINQNIILSFGILPDVLNFVLEYCNSGNLFVARNYKKKLIECIALLRALTCNNLGLQTRLLHHLDAFIKATSGDLGQNISELLREIFRGGPSITLSLNEDQLWRMMLVMFRREKEADSMNTAALLDALNELLHVKELGLPLKHNQLIIAKLISLIRDDDRYWCNDLLGKGSSVRWEILTSKDDADPRLHNLLIITDLLATCAYGDNTGVDSVCCTIYSEEELVEIISSDEISLYRKRPFMKLLVWVYMNVRGEKAETRSSYYQGNIELLDHMNKMAAIILRMSETMKNMPHSSYLSVKELLASSSWKYLHDCPDRKHTREPPKIVVEGDEDYQEQFNIPDLLLYIFESFFPYIWIFYSEYATTDSLKESSTTKSIFKAICSLHPVLNCKRVYFCQEDQVKLYYRVLFITKPHDYNIFQEIHVKHSKIEDFFQQQLISSARLKYSHTYHEEIELNKIFSKFIHNYKAAYEGRNTKRDQVIADPVTKKNYPDTEPYSDFLDEDMTKPGPKYLPLGRSFQEHVAIFSSRDETGCRERNPKEKLLKQLEVSLLKGNNKATDQTEIDLQTELDIKCLQILRAVIYNQSLMIDEEDKERNPKKFRKQCEHYLYPVQNEIQDLGNTVSRVMPLLSHPNEKIVHEVLAFLDTLLGFNNTHVQNGLKALIKMHGQLVLPALKSMLKRASIDYNESQLLLSLHKAQVAFDMKTIDVSKSKEVEVEVEAEADTNSETEVSHSYFRSLSTQTDKTFKSIGKFFGEMWKESSQDISEYEDRIPFMALYQHADSDVDEKAHQILHFYDLSHITLLCKVLGVMCDGQFREMQNYLREQTKDSNSINIVKEIASFLYDFSKKQVISIETLQLFNQLLQTLIEFCTGNYKNREVVFNANIVTVINNILHIDISNLSYQKSGTTIIDFALLRKMALEVKASTVQLLDVMLEEISNKSHKLCLLISEGLDISGLHRSMLDFYILKSDPDLIRLKYDDNAYRAMVCSYKIIMRLVDSGFASLESMIPTDRYTLRAWDFCAQKSQSIEVVYRDEELEEEVLTRVHFSVNIEGDIRKELKNRLKFTVLREPHADKMRDFHKWMVAIKKDTLHHDRLKKNKLYLVMTFSRVRYWLLLFVTLLLNILLVTIFNPTSEVVGCLTFYHHDFMNHTRQPEVDQFVISHLTLCSIYAILVVWMLIEHFTVNWPHFVLPKILYSIVKFLRKQAERYRLPQWIIRIKVLPKVERTYSSVDIFGPKNVYLVGLLAVAVSPLYCIGYIYCITFFYIIIDNDILQRALQSVTKNWKSLLWVAILLVIIIYILAVVSFAFLSEILDLHPDIICQSFIPCFVSVLRFGLIENFLGTPVHRESDAETLLFYDLAVFIFVTTIGLSIVFGIILDTFSELRDERFHAEQDMRSRCFICDLSSQDFEKLGNNEFERHIKEDHHMWSYIFYSIYLDQIDVTNHNAIEKYIYKRIQSGNIDYIPFEKALVLESTKKDEELKLELEQLQQSIDDRFSAMSCRFDALEDLIQKKTDF